MALARIGLGSNAGDPAAHIAAAFAALDGLGSVVRRSSLYRSKAWGVADQPDFCNAAALLETDLAPRTLLGALKGIEADLGRVATFRWGPRVIDLDILAYDDLVIREPDLVIPHERLYERAFALAPLAEIDSGFAEALAALSQAARAEVQRIPIAAARKAPTVNWDEALQRVRSAAEFCASSGLSRFRIDDEALAIDVRRTPRPLAVPASAAAVPGDLALPGAPHGANGSTGHDEPPHSIVKAEFVGIVRMSRPSVTPGAELTEDRELAYVESLGIRNPVRSGGPGRVAEIFVTDGEPVEYGQPLFAIEI